MRPFLLLGLLVGSSVMAQTAALPDAVNLEQALELLEARSPRTLADRAQLDVVAADAITAGTWPNPTFSYGGQQLAAGANTGSAGQHQFVLEQPLLLFGQRGVRGEAAALGLAAERARVAAALSDRRKVVRESFAALLARQEEQKILEDSVSNLERAQNVVKARASAGDRSAYDVARIEAETVTLKAELLNTGADVEDAAGHLAAALGFAGWTPRAVGTLDPSELPVDLAQLNERAARDRPALLAARARQASARGGLTLAQRERFPVPSIALGAQIGRNADNTAVIWGLSIPLAVLDRNQGPIARATADVQAQELGLAAQDAEVRAEVEHAHAVLLKRRAALASLEREVVDRVPALQKMAEDAYREGRTGILELLDAFRSLKDLKLQHLKQREAAKLAEAQVISAAALDAPGAH